MPSTSRHAFRRAAFSLVELLVAVAVIGLLCLLLAQLTDQTARTWRYTSSKSEEFREARAAFETMTTRISQATLNTYWDYDYAPAPTRYERRSELRFICGNADSPSNLLGDYNGATRVTHCIFFHAPLGFVDDTQVHTADTQIHGLEGLLNVWGYFVELNDDSTLRPSILGANNSAVPLRVRFRLMEMMTPSEKMQTYEFTSGTAINLLSKAKTYTGKQWYQNIANSAAPNTHVLAENVVALILHPELSSQDKTAISLSNGAGSVELASNYLYDSTVSTNSNNALNSKDQLPPVMRVTMAAIDEASALRLGLSASSGNIFNLQGKFQSASNFRQDLMRDTTQPAEASLENTLVAMKVNYRVFTTTVPIRAAKWSLSQSSTP